MKRQSYAEALPVFRTLFNAYPDSPAARDTGLLTQLAAGRAADDLLRTVPAPVASFVRCRVAADAERFDESVEHCRATLALDPHFPGARRELGRALVGQHDAGAIDALREAIQQSPVDPEAHYYLGVALLQGDRLDDAARSLERSRELDPNFWGTWFYLGKAKLKRNQIEAAIPLLQKATELNPNAATVFYELGLALNAAGRTGEARRAMDRVRDLRARELHADQEALRKK